ncbi:methyltransferase domain-containing protein [Patescibacteria group bacterium]
MKKIKLHLGCGERHIDGFINIDIKKYPAVDMVDDIRYLKKFKRGTIDVIYACNVLEHLGRWKYMPALKRWYTLLKKGGILRISVPNFRALCEYYLKTGDLKTIYCALYAGQDDPLNYHYWCWDFEILEKELKSIGFKKIKKYDRNKTEHASVRDWSLNFVPYRNKKNKILPDKKWFKGKFIALNVEAQK